MRFLPLPVAAVLAAALTAAPALAAPARQFLDDAVKGDNGEVAVGRLAQQKGADQGVRDFGRMLEHDHAMARDQAMATARDMHLRVDADGMKPESMRLQRRLSRLSGRDFDRVFVNGMIEDHRKDIAKFEAQARNGDRATSRLARETLPHLREHLRTALSLRH